MARETNTNITLAQQSLPHSHSVVIRALGSLARPEVARDRIMQMMECTRGGDCDRNLTASINMSSDSYDSVLDITETIMIPKVQYHKLVSTGYMALNKIALRVGCSINITEDTSNGMGIVSFRGNRLQVEEAQDMLHSAFNRRPHTFTTSSVPPGFHVAEGTAGESGGRERGDHAESHSPFSSHLMSKYKSSQMMVSPEQDRKRHSFTGHSASTMNSQSSTPLSGVRVRSTKTTPMRTGPVSAFLDCEYDRVGKLIGVKGSRIEELRTLTGCKINVLKGNNSGMCRVEVRGKHERVSTAVPLLKMVLGSGDVAMSKIRALHSSLELQARSSSGDDDDTCPLPPRRSSDMMEASGDRDSSTGGSLSLDRLAQALQSHIERLSPGSTPTSDMDRDRAVAHPVEELNRSGSVAQSPLTITSSNHETPLSESRPPRSRVISRQSSSKDEGYIEAATAKSPVDGIAATMSSVARLSPGLLGSYPAPYVSSSDSESGEEDCLSKDGDNSTSRSVESRTKYTVSPPSSPPTSTLFPEYFFRHTAAMRNEEVYQCADETCLLNRHVLDDIAMKARCQITVEEERSQLGQMLLRLKGQTDQRELAKLLISSVVKPSFQHSPGLAVIRGGLDGVIRTMTCPPHFIPVLIGPGGSTIENIQNQSATKILINENKNEV